MLSPRVFGNLFCHFFPLFFIFKPLPALAAFSENSETSRQAIVAPRTKKFYKVDEARQYLALGGTYTSDYNSAQYQLNSRYFYQSNRFINEANFMQQTDYKDAGSGKGKRYKTKTGQIYDGSLSSKAIIGETKNYGVFYHRTVYNKFSDYYYDNHTALGVGRMFFKDRIELDTSLGYHNTKNFGSAMSFISSIRVNLKLTDKLTFVQRGYWFVDERSADNELKTSLVYRLNQKLSFELRYSFEQRRYDETEKSRVVNQQNKVATIGVVMDL
jgi:hypothetical protein